MDFWVHERLEINGEPKRLRDALLLHTPELVQTATESPITKPSGDASFTATVDTEALGIKGRKQVRVHIGQASEHGPWVRVPIRWEADPAKWLFPSFEGGIELEEHDRTTVEVALTGHYTPPLGAIGAAGDALLFRGSAHELAARLLDQLATALLAWVYGDGEAPAQPETDPSVLTVGDLASRELLTIPQDLSLRAAANLLLVAEVSGAPVVDDDGKVVGMLSASDLLDKAATERFGMGADAYEAWRRYTAVTAGQACTAPARMTEADTTVRDAAAEMARHDVDRLVVMDGAKVIGIISRTDVLRALIRADSEIRDAVQEVLDERGEEHVEVEVGNGLVHLSGKVHNRSDLGPVCQAVEQVDGVLHVGADDLEWETDDVPPMMPMT